MRFRTTIAGMIPALALLTTEAGAQASMSPRVLGGGGGVVVVPDDPRLDPDSPESRAHAALRKREREIERELRLIQRRHFGSMRNLERREQGLRKLRAYTEPAALLVMTELFDREADDVRLAILDHFFSLASPEGDAALAWESVHGEGESYRASARGLLARRERTPDPDPRVAAVIADALRGSDDAAAVEAGRLASALRLYQFIPMMATAQVARGGGGGGAGNRTGDLGWIMIGRQTAFIADLVPVVSNSAVGLDPQVAVVSDGVMLRVHEAVVTVYRTELFETLVEMTTDAWGRPTRSLGYDAGKWRAWYDTEFVPFLAAGDARPQD